MKQIGRNGKPDLNFPDRTSRLAKLQSKDANVIHTLD